MNPWEQDWGNKPPARQQQSGGGNPWEQKWSDGRFKKKSEVESFLSGAGDAFSFGLGDELLGFARGGFDEEARHRYTEESRNQQRLAMMDNPLWYGGGQLAGAAAGTFAGGGIVGGAARLGQFAGTAARAANVAKNIGYGGRIAATAATGALGGAAYGAGSQRGDLFSDERLGGAAEGALWGAGLAGGLRAVGEPVGRALAPVFSSKARAARQMGKTLDRFGSTPARLAKDLADAPDNALAMDVIPGGTQIVMGAGTRPSMEKEVIREALDNRNNAMGDEAVDDLWESVLGKKHRIDAGRRILSIKEAKSGINYNEVDAQVIKPTKQAQDFILHHYKSSGNFKSAIDDTLAEMRIGDPLNTGLRAVGEQQWDYHLMQQPKFWRTVLTKVREDVSMAERAARVSGAGMGTVRNMKRDYLDFRNEMGKFMGDKWKGLQSQYKNLADEEDAIRFGYDAMKLAGDIDLGDWINDFRRLSPEEQHWARQGALAHLEDIINKADSGSGRADVLRSIIGNKSKVNTLNHILGRVTVSGKGDRRMGLSKVLDRLEEQRTLFDNSVKSGIGVNSHTADKIAAMNAQQMATNPSAGGIKDALLRAVSGETIDQFDESVSNEILKFMRKPAPEMRAEIAAAGGVEQWLRGKELLALAMRQQRPQFRQRELSNALLGGLYANVGGDAVITGLTGQ